MESVYIAAVVVVSKNKEPGADDGEEGTICRQSLTRSTCAKLRSSLFLKVKVVYERDTL